jgi:D-3-phosphoglycerate dehydrogenase
MINKESIALMKDGVYIINVARGPLIDEPALIDALQTGKVRAAGLDVFEVEPLPADSPLRQFDQCIFGTHNGSNTKEAVIRASLKAIDILFGYLNIK